MSFLDAGVQHQQNVDERKKDKEYKSKGECKITEELMIAEELINGKEWLLCYLELCINLNPCKSLLLKKAIVCD